MPLHPESRQPSFAVVGTSLARIDGVQKVTGRAAFGADVTMAGMLWCAFVRSPLPHARIRSIDVSKARALRGVHAVITGRDVPARLWGRRLQDVPVLATEKVRFIGEKVAGIAAEDRDTAAEAALLVEVDYEELPAVFDAELALLGNVLVHDPRAAYQDAPQSWGSRPNVQSVVVSEHGEIDRAFGEAELVFEHEFRTQPVHQGYIEPHACLARVDDSGRLQLLISNKMPSRTQELLGPLLDLPMEAIDITPTSIGGDFGGKGSPMDAPAVVYLAMRTRRPVKYVMTYADDLAATNPRHSGVIRLKTGLKRDGTIVARQATVVWDAGAYGGFKPSPSVSVGGHQLVGSYHIPNYRLEVTCVYTNSVPRGHARAPGGPQCYFASESHMDMVASELGMDPLELRLKNGQRQRGTDDPDPRLVEVVRRAVSASGWSGAARPGAMQGRGIAIGDHGTGVGFATIRLTLECDGRVTLLTGLPDTGTGALTVLRQVAAEELGIAPERVDVRNLGTLHAPADSGAGGSRVTHVGGRATVGAAKALKTELARRGLTLTTVDEPVSAEFTYSAPRGSGNATGFICQIACVAVDAETGQVTVEGLTTAHEVGTVINPRLHQGQIEGGIIQGLGFAMMEDLHIADGRVGAVHLGDYKLPTIADVPNLRTELVDSSDGPGPFAAKAIGESSNILTAAALANAVFDACGVRITELPVTSEKVYHGLRALEFSRKGSGNAQPGRQ